MKKIGLLFATLLMIMLFAFSASAATTEDGFTYTIKNGEVTITGYEGTSTELVIPNEIDGYPVTSISDYAFSHRSDLTGDLVIPEGIISIDYWAFNGCSGFTGSLVIPNSVTSIGPGAFADCSGFTGSLVIPNSVTSIGPGAFARCSGFTGDLVIPDSVTSIEGSTFDSCSGFTGNLVISDSATSIGSYAFRDCNGFTGDLVIPNSVTIIEYQAFSGCSGFDGNLVLSDKLSIIESSCFTNCKGLTGNLVLPKGLKSIGDFAFAQCSGLTGDLIIPEGVTNIDRYAFSLCYGLNGELVLPDTVISIGDKAFYKLDFKHKAFCGDKEHWSFIDFGEEGIAISRWNIHYNYDPDKDVIQKNIPVSCNNDGEIKTVCSCGYVKSVIKTDLAYGHDMSDFFLVKDAGCMENGMMKSECSRCEYFVIKLIPAIKHKDENADGYCDICGIDASAFTCLCTCHAKTIGAILYKLFKIIDDLFGTKLLNKIFNITEVCTCGLKH